MNFPFFSSATNFLKRGRGLFLLSYCSSLQPIHQAALVSFSVEREELTEE